jgi:hypothetical protein
MYITFIESCNLDMYFILHIILLIKIKTQILKYMSKMQELKHIQFEPKMQLKYIQTHI